MRHKRTVLFALLLTALLIGGVGLWLRAAQRQYALNRQLIAALAKGYDKQALALINEGADPNTPYFPPPMPTLPQLLEHVFHHSVPPDDQCTAFTIVCGQTWGNGSETIGVRESMPLVQSMLSHGARVNPSVDDRWPPLIWAIYYDRSKTVHLLLKYGADVNRLWQGDTALGWAAQDGETEMVRQLLENGADPNRADEDGQTPLMLIKATRSDYPEVVALLKQYGARK